MSHFEQMERERERQFQYELNKEIRPEERDYLENELEHTDRLHETMKEILDSIPHLDRRPILLVDAVDRGTVGSDFFTDVNPELLNYFMRIHTGHGFNRRTDKFDYRDFPSLLFRHLFGMEKDDPRLVTVRTMDPESELSLNPNDFSLVLGTGGEVNHKNTQEEYVHIVDKIKPFFSKLLDSNTPFAMACASHQLLGQAAAERAGHPSFIIDELKQEDGSPITETGIVDLFATPESKNNFYTSDLPDKFSIISNHGQYLTEIPPGAVSLAANRFKGQPIPTQLLAYENGISIQAHPEFSPAVDLIKQRLTMAQAAWEGITLPPYDGLDNRPTWTAREYLFPKILQDVLRRS
jgi:GMP synthase-like glutamine amidotransferase